MAIGPSDLSQALMEDLLSQGLPVQGGFWPGMTIEEAAAVSISNSLLKKWVPDTTEAADKAALDKFLASNQSCAEWSLPVNYDSKSEMLLNGFKQAVESFWFKNGYALTDDPRDCFSAARVGPGSNVLATGGSLYHKLFSSELSCSNKSLYNWYKHCISRLPEWSNAELIRIENYGSARVVRGSKLSFVPKNDKISRCICVEPTLNTWFQLGLGHILEQRLKSRFQIDLSKQQFINRNLARLGSITDGLSTIDLSSASDSISYKMCQWALPADMLRQLEFARTPVVEVPGLGAVQLNMVSTMGNGYTFPLQTMLFSCAVVACLHFRGIPERRNRSDSLWGVYGDDIICPSSVTSDVIHLLALLGFRVNDDKSFVKGPFRESCGSDFYNGTDIRGVYLKAVSSPQEAFVAINSLTQFSTKTGIFLGRLLRLLLSLFRDWKKHVVPPWENADSGIRIPYRVARRVASRAPFTGGFWYFAHRVTPMVVRFSETDIVVPRRCKPLIYNPSGLLLSFCNGVIRGGVLAVRSDSRRYTRKRLATTMWHEIGCPGNSTKDRIERLLGIRQREAHRSDTDELDWGRWETTVEDHLADLEIHSGR